MPWRDMIMGEPTRLLEWANAGAMLQVNFSDASIVCCCGDYWVVTCGSVDDSEAADFVSALAAHAGAR